MVKAVTTFEHAFLSGKFFINEGLVMFLFFFLVARRSTWTFCP